MPTYYPAPGVYVGRPPCAHCGANYHLHAKARQGWAGACPEAYRPDTLSTAITVLRRAGGGESRFAARGEVQRLLGHRPGTCSPLCEGCAALLETA